jgi:hypothetical protein
MGQASTGQERAGNDPLVIQYLDLRTAIGLIGSALPAVLAGGRALLEGPGLLDSMSGYYHSGMRDVFVGSLCAVGVFLFSYRGYDWRDALAGKIASASVVGVALCRTTPPGQRTDLLGGLHVFFAAVYFLTLAVFALVLFRKTDSPEAMTRRKRSRNRVYAICGWTIVACLGLIVLAELLPDGSSWRSLRPVFWLEAIAVEAFGVSWLVKGEAILKDEPESVPAPVAVE